MWGFWRITSKIWLIFILASANIMLLISIVVIYNLGINYPIELVFAGLVVTLSILSWNLLPPTVLLLASSREESVTIASELQVFLLVKGLRIAYLLDSTIAIPGDGSRFYMDNFRGITSIGREPFMRLCRSFPLSRST
jgi:hypothetical protein